MEPVYRAAMVPHLVRWVKTCRGDSGRVGGTIVLAALCVIAAVQAGAAQPAATPMDELTTYRIDAGFDDERATIGATMTIDWLNATDQAQDVVYLRLFPNAPYYGAGDLWVEAASIDGERVESVDGDDPTTVGYEPPEPVAIGARATIELAFTTTVPPVSDASFGIFGGDAVTGWALANWYPIIAGWEDGAWYIPPPTKFGDPTFSDTAVYEVSITTPDDLVVIASGAEIARDDDRENAERTTDLRSGPGRDFTLSLLPETRRSRVEMVERDVGGVTVRVSGPDDLAIPGLADDLAGIAGDALPLYEEWLGDYAETELDIVLAPLAGSSGVAWNGVVWLDVRRLVADGAIDEQERKHLRFVLTHEIGHQWIAHIVGSNNNDHGFMTEGLVNHIALLVLGDVYGASAAEEFLYGWVAGSYVGLVRDGRDGIADAPVTDDTNIVIRSFLVYGKAAVGFEAIRQQIGDDAYLDGLAGYAAEFRFGVSGPADLLAAFESGSGEDLGALWSFWFDQAETEIDDLEPVLDAFRPLE